MKLFNLLFKNILLITSLFLVSLPSFAYRIANQTEHVLRVHDSRFGETGIDALLAPGQSQDCDAKSKGCAKNIHFQVYAVNSTNTFSVCEWQGYIQKGEKGHKFNIVKNTNNIIFPEPGWCMIEHHHA